jgi:hypothetical protein
MRQGELVHGIEHKTALEAEGFRCYSEADDTAWREELQIQTDCCSAPRDRP